MAMVCHGISMDPPYANDDGRKVIDSLVVSAAVIGPLKGDGGDDEDDTGDDGEAGECCEGDLRTAAESDKEDDKEEDAAPAAEAASAVDGRISLKSMSAELNN